MRRGHYRPSILIPISIVPLYNGRLDDISGNRNNIELVSGRFRVYQSRNYGTWGNAQNCVLRFSNVLQTTYLDAFRVEIEFLIEGNLAPYQVFSREGVFVLSGFYERDRLCGIAVGSKGDSSFDAGITSMDNEFDDFPNNVAGLHIQPTPFSNFNQTRVFLVAIEHYNGVVVSSLFDYTDGHYRDRICKNVSTFVNDPTVGSYGFKQLYIGCNSQNTTMNFGGYIRNFKLYRIKYNARI